MKRDGHKQGVWNLIVEAAMGERLKKKLVNNLQKWTGFRESMYKCRLVKKAVTRKMKGKRRRGQLICCDRRILQRKRGICMNSESNVGGE